MQPENDQTLDAAETAIRQALSARTRRLLVVGVCGAQGCGKSTLAKALARRFDQTGIRTAVLSLDDLYRTRAERAALAAQVHPLLRTRGVPGTHDVTLGLNLITALDDGRATALPRFDKARDDRAGADHWGTAEADTELLILEGWCVGARPQSEAALTEPINPLERDDDRQGIWRRFANTALAGDYQRLFARIDVLILLAAPGFDVVRAWRTEQEQELRARAGPDAPGLMSDDEIAHFIQYYERLTNHILTEMPARADLMITLAKDRSAQRIRMRPR